jgi:hypothetical protein
MCLSYSTLLNPVQLPINSGLSSEAHPDIRVAVVEVQQEEKNQYSNSQLTNFIEMEVLVLL